MTVMKGVFCPKNKWTQIADATTYSSFFASPSDTTQTSYFWVYTGASMPTSLPADGFTDAIRNVCAIGNRGGWASGDGNFTGSDKAFICPERDQYFTVTQY